MNQYIFEHPILKRTKEGYISRISFNSYSILAKDSRLAHRQVPEGSILKRILSGDGARVLYDFSKEMPYDVGVKSLRGKLSEFGRDGLSTSEYNEAIKHGLIQ